MKNTRIALVIVVIIAALFYQFMKEGKIQNQKKSGVTVYNKKEIGVSVLAEFYQKTDPQSLFVGGVNLLQSYKKLLEYNLMVIADPYFPLSQSEGKVVKEWVSRGGHLILMPGSQKMMGEYWSILDFPEDLKVRDSRHYEKSFRQEFELREEGLLRQSDRPSAKQHPSLFQVGEKYSFYSAHVFDDERCTKDEEELDCFVKELYLGSGKVTLLLGVAPLTNAMISQKNNPEILFRLKQNYPKLYIDEYHHFFTQKTLKDLLSEPKFIFPMVILFCLLVGFFLLTYHPESPVEYLTQRKHSQSSYHGINEALIRQNMATPEGKKAALEYQCQIIEQMEGVNAEELLSSLRTQAKQAKIKNEDFISQALQISQQHISMMKKKGKQFL